MDAIDSADRERGQRLEEALASLIYAGIASAGLENVLDPLELEEANLSVRKMVLERTHRGSGGLEQWFPLTLAAWRRARPSDAELGELAEAFCASAACRAWREPFGICLEEAFARFFAEARVGDPETRDDELMAAVVRSLAVTPRAAFAWPSQLRPAPGGCFAVSSKLELHAALDGKLHRGTISPLVAHLLDGVSVQAVASAHALPESDVRAVADELRAMRLLP